MYRRPNAFSVALPAGSDEAFSVGPSPALKYASARNSAAQQGNGKNQGVRHRRKLTFYMENAMSELVAVFGELPIQACNSGTPCQQMTVRRKGIRLYRQK